MVDVKTMTAEQVRFELAILRGADQSLRVEYDAATGKQRVLEHAAYDRRGIPDWPNDLGMALAMCLGIAREHPGSVWSWSCEVTSLDDGKYLARFQNNHTVYYVASADTPALALSRLALRALRENVGGCHE